MDASCSSSERLGEVIINLVWLLSKSGRHMSKLISNLPSLKPSVSVTNTDVDLLKAGPRAPLPFIPPLIIIWVYLHLLFLQRSVLDLSLHILFTNLSSPFQKMSLFFSPLKLSSNSTLSKAESLIKPILYGSLCRSYFLAAPKLYIYVLEISENYVRHSLNSWVLHYLDKLMKIMIIT